MNKEIATLWTKALRSKEFPQIKHQLESKKGFCILGVLSALALAEGACTYGTRGFGSFDGRKFSLSYFTQEWAGVKTGKAEFVYNGKYTSLADLNDSGLTFVELAAIIDQDWDKL